MDRVVRRAKLREPRLPAAVVGDRLAVIASSDAFPIGHEKSREPRVVVTFGTCKVCRCCKRVSPGCDKTVDELLGTRLDVGLSGGVENRFESCVIPSLLGCSGFVVGLVSGLCGSLADAGRL